MVNEILFFSFAIFCLSVILIIFRFGKLYLFILISIFTIMMNIFVLKQFNLFGLMLTGGNILYGSLFLITDLLSEHYGKKEAFRGIFIGFITSIFFVISLQFLLHFTPNSEDFAQESLEILFNLSPRILLASLISYLISQNIDIIIFDKIKRITNNKFLWLRNNLSTFISQAIDTLFFTFFGLTTFTFLNWTLHGVIDTNIFWEIALATYLIKIIVALIDTPFIYLSYKIKK